MKRTDVVRDEGGNQHPALRKKREHLEGSPENPERPSCKLELTHRRLPIDERSLHSKWMKTSPMHFFLFFVFLPF